METNFLSVIQAMLEFSMILTIQLLVIMVLRIPVRRWFGAINAYRLWLLPLLWLPFTLVDLSALSVDSLLAFLSRNELNPVVEGGLVSSGIAGLNLDISLPTLPQLSLAQAESPGIWQLLGAFWFFGILALLIRESRNMFLFDRFVKREGKVIAAPQSGRLLTGSMFHRAIPVRLLKGMNSPALYGVFRPQLLLPENFLERYDADQRHVILSHEAVHLNRLDNTWNLLTYLLGVVCWFNPVVHIALRLYRLDQELSCDARALEHCNPQQSQRYAGTLVASVENAMPLKHPPIIAAWENPRELKERITMINQHLKLKSHPVKVSICSLIIILAGSVLTACVSDDAVNEVAAAEAEQSAPLPARSDDIVSRRVFTRINEIIALRDQGDYDAALAKIDEIKALDEAGRLNSREQFVMWQFTANLYLHKEMYADAVTAYSQLLALPNLKSEQHEQALLMLGSLHMVMNDYVAAIAVFEEYNLVASEPNEDVYYRLAAAHYQLGQYEQALPLAEQHIVLLEQAGEEVPESSRSLLSALQGNARAVAAGGPLVEFDINASNYSIKPAEMEMLPIVTFQPRYPQQAIDEHIEGWALVGFTVTEEGSVSNARIIDADPESIFDEASIAAAEKFMFNPRIDNGRAVEAEGVRYLFRFSLAQ